MRRPFYAGKYTGSIYVNALQVFTLMHLQGPARQIKAELPFIL